MLRSSRRSLHRLAPVLALPILLAAVPACAEHIPALSDINLGERVSGPKVTAKDLKGRIVVFANWSATGGHVARTVPALAKLQAKYPYQVLIVVANCKDGADAAGFAWADHADESAHEKAPKAVVVAKGSVTDNKSGAPASVWVFDVKGKLAYRGDIADTWRLAAAVDRVVVALPAWKGLKNLLEAERVFGPKIPDELLAAAKGSVDTAQPSAKFTEIIATAAKSKKAELATRAQEMLAAFDKEVAAQYAGAVAQAKDEPVAAMARMEAFTKWVPQKDESAKAHAQIKAWRRDTKFLQELVADMAWLDLKAKAEAIDYDAHPNAKPTPVLESAYKKMLKDPDMAETKGLVKAKAAVWDWKLDPATGSADKWNPAVKPELPAEPKADAGAALVPAPDAATQPAIQP